MQVQNTNLALDIPSYSNYQCGMNGLKDLRTAKNLTQAALADLAGTSQPQIRRLENGERQMTKDWAERLAPHLGVSAASLMFPGSTVSAPQILQPKTERHAGNTSPPPEPDQPLFIKGEVAAGLWMEADLFDSERVEKSHIVGGDGRFPASSQYLLRIRGESLNRIAQDGDLILCLDYGQAGIELQSGDLVVVERSRDGGHTLERTAKRIVRHNGEIELRPESTDPRFQEPVTFNEHDEEATEVRIIAKILSVIREF